MDMQLAVAQDQGAAQLTSSEISCMSAPVYDSMHSQFLVCCACLVTSAETQMS